jgi:hypothetical protein
VSLGNWSREVGVWVSGTSLLKAFDSQVPLRGLVSGPVL